jgi:hypothetical protein
LDFEKDENQCGYNTMAEPVSLLMLEFLAWVSTRRRSYDEAAEAWRSTCPRHTEWEDAFMDGLVQVVNGSESDHCAVTLTARGRALLEAYRPSQPVAKHDREEYGKQPPRR